MSLHFYTEANADVFGRVFDATGENALDRDEASDAGRISNISKVPPGEGGCVCVHNFSCSIGCKYVLQKVDIQHRVC